MSKTILFLILFCLGMISCFLAGVKIGSEAIWKSAIREGYAQNNSKTGNIEWIPHEKINL